MEKRKDSRRPPKTEPLLRRASRWAAWLKGGEIQDQLLRRETVWIVLFFLFVLLFSLRFSRAPVPVYAEGAIAEVSIKAPIQFDVVDEAATRERRQEARDAVVPVYDYDSRYYDRRDGDLQTGFLLARERLTAPEATPPDPGADDLRRQEVQAQFPLPLDEPALEFFLRRAFDEETLTALLAALHQAQVPYVVADRQAMPLSQAGDAIIVRDLHQEGERPVQGLAQIQDLAQARTAALEACRETGLVDRRGRFPLRQFVTDLVKPNLNFNSNETERRRKEAAASVDALITNIPKGRIIVREGEVVTTASHRALVALGTVMESSGQDLVKTLGLVAVLALVLAFFHRVVRIYQRPPRQVKNAFSILVTLLLTGLVVCAGTRTLAAALMARIPEMAELTTPGLAYAVPWSMGALLALLLTNVRLATLTAVLFSLTASLLFDYRFPMFCFILISNLCAILITSQYMRRSSLVKTGLLLGVLNLGAYLSLQLLNEGNVDAINTNESLACLAGGVVVAVVGGALLPFFEWAFNSLTDVRLLELSNSNTPLLQELAMRAPGTYNHSLIVGTLAEAAAKAVDGNPLFCRVAAYYHDIGKMNRPEYFIENQHGGENKHDKLPPPMSALIIASHVKEGIEMAKQYGLARPIMDIIPQHHGTRLITYFHEKAKQQAKDPEEVKEEDYRYPGPKPQTKEAAIFMLADSVEASARTLENPTPARFRSLIRQVIDRVVRDGQYDECDVTFKDLDRITEAFVKSLVSVYHHRIAYPTYEFEERKPGKRPPAPRSASH